MPPSRVTAWFVKNWFFFGLALVLVLGYAIPAPVAQVAAVTLGPYKLSVWMITTIMVFTAFTLPLKNIGAGAKNWVGLLLLLAMTYAVYPLIAFGVVEAGWHISGVDPATTPHDGWIYGAGLILMAAVPTTLASGIIWTRQAGGDDALALVGMVLSLLASILLTPLVLSITLFPLVGRGVAMDPSELRAKLIHDLTFLILIPVLAGQLLRLIRPLATQGDRYKKQISVFLQLIILATIWFSVAGQMATNRAMPGMGVLVTVLISTLLIHIATLIVAWFTARAAGRSRPVVICVGLNGAQKTLPVALLILKLLPGDWDAAIWSLILVHVVQLTFDALLIPPFKAWAERSESVPATG